MTDLTRRTGLSAAAATACALGAGAPASPTQAAAPPAGKQAPGFYRYKVGDIEVTAVTDGANVFPLPDSFVVNAKKDEVAKALAEGHRDPATLTVPYTPIVVNTGGKLVVIDTGLRALEGRRRPVPDEPQGGRHRPQRRRHGGDLAFPRRPRERPPDGVQQARLP